MSPDDTDLTRTHDALLAELVEEYLDRRRRGERPDAAELGARWPGEPTRLREALSAASFLEDAARTRDPEPLGRLGDFRVVRELGRGGMGVVYEAEQLSLRRRVALKVMAPTGIVAEEQVARFRREAGVASRLDHPGICTVYAAGIEDGVPYIAMRYVEGETLARRIAARRDGEGEGAVTERLAAPPTSATEATAARPGEATTRPASSPPTSRDDIRAIVRFFELAARALHVAHEAQIVHRDIKPGNVMVTPAGDPVLLDFGLARDLGAEDATITRPGAVFGTPAYMSPEQVRGQPLDATTDVYSLGVSLYETLTLRRPFEAPTRDLMVHSILHADPVSARVANPRVPRDLDTVLETALRKRPANRYASAAALADDLRRFLAGEPVAARRTSPLGRAVRWAGRRPALAGLLVVATVAAVVVAALGGFIAAKLPAIRQQQELDRQDAVERALVDGFHALAEGATGAARRDFGAARDLDPANVEAAAGLVLSWLNERQTARAVAVLDVSRAAGGSEVLERMRVAALRQLDRVAEAEALSERLGEPRTPLILFLAAESILASGEPSPPDRLRLAFEYLRRAVLLSKSARRLYYFQLAHAAGQLDDAPEARAVAAALTSFWPDDARAWGWAGYAVRRVDPTAARASYEKSIALDPSSRALGDLAELLLEQGDADTAIAHFHRALELEPGSAVLWNNLGVLYQRRGDVDRAREAWLTAIDRDPGHLPARNHLAILRFEQGDGDGALADLEDALARGPARVATHLNLAVMLEHLGRYDEAEARLQIALDLAPYDAELWHVLGTVRYQRDDVVGAIAAFGRAADLGRPWARLGQAKMLEEAGRTGEALTAYRAAAVALGEEAAPWLEVARLGEGEGDLAAAAAALGRVASEADGDPSVATRLGELQLRLGRTAAAIDSFRRACRSAPEDEEPRGRLVSALIEGGNFDEALAELGAGAPTESLQPVAELARDHAAIAKRIAAGVPDPDSPGERLRFARVAFRIGRDEAALPWFRRALAAPDDDGVAARDFFEAALCAIRLAAADPAASALRTDGRAWLQEYLLRLEEARDDGAAYARPALVDLAVDERFAAVRDAAARAAFPIEERRAWASFWNDVAAARD